MKDRVLKIRIFLASSGWGAPPAALVPGFALGGAHPFACIILIQDANNFKPNSNQFQGSNRIKIGAHLLLHGDPDFALGGVDF